jgi:hypothetical protein
LIRGTPMATWGLGPDLDEALRGLGVEPSRWTGGPLAGDAVALVMDLRGRGPVEVPPAGTVVLAVHADAAPAWASVAVAANDLSRDLPRALVAAAALGAAKRTLERERTEAWELVELVAHDLRNPLAAIRANLSMIGMGELDQDTTEAIEDSTMAADNALRIIDNHAMVAAIEAGRTLPADSSDARTAVIEAVRRVRAASDASAIPVVAEVPEDSFPCPVHSHILASLLDNLLSVALRYAPRGTDVRIRLERLEAAARVVVSDGGVPVPPEYARRIFEREFQAESKRIHAGRYGRGLGLYTVGLLAAFSGAKVSCAPDGGRNAYWLEVPLSPDEA